MANIFYGGVDAFSGICATPYVSLSYETNGYWSSENQITLEGELVLCGSSGLSGAFAKKSRLYDNFKNNFLPFSIYDENRRVLHGDVAVVKSVNFKESDYAYFLPFSIELALFDSGAFSGKYGVVDPENSFDISQGEDDYLYSIEHKISAKGKNTPFGLAIDNAKSWVLSQTGLHSFPYPAFLPMHTYQQPILLSQNETINRLNGEYSISESYTFDQAFSGYGILRYTSDISISRDGFNTVSIDGNLNCGPNGSFDSIVGRYGSLDLWSMACEAYSGVFGKVDLYNVPTTISIQQKQAEGMIDFKIEYNNDTSPDIVVISTSNYRESFDPDDKEDAASITAVVKCIRGPLSERYDKAKAYAFNPIGQFALDMAAIGKSYNYSQFKQSASSSRHSPKDGSVTYSMSWGVKKTNAVLPCYIKECEYTVQKAYPLKQYDLKQPLCPQWNAYYRHNSQTIISINGTIRYESSRKTEAEAFIENIVQNFRFGMPNINKKTISHSNMSDSTSSASFSYEFDDAIIF